MTCDEQCPRCGELGPCAVCDLCERCRHLCRCREELAAMYYEPLTPAQAHETPEWWETLGAIQTEPSATHWVEKPGK